MYVLISKKVICIFHSTSMWKRPLKSLSVEKGDNCAIDNSATGFRDAQEYTQLWLWISIYICVFVCVCVNAIRIISCPVTANEISFIGIYYADSVAVILDNRYAGRDSVCQVFFFFLVLFLSFFPATMDHSWWRFVYLCMYTHQCMCGAYKFPITVKLLTDGWIFRWIPYKQVRAFSISAIAAAILNWQSVGSAATAAAAAVAAAIINITALLPEIE